MFILKISSGNSDLPSINRPKNRQDDRMPKRHVILVGMLPLDLSNALAAIGIASLYIHFSPYIVKLIDSISVNSKCNPKGGGEESLTRVATSQPKEEMDTTDER